MAEDEEGFALALRLLATADSAAGFARAVALTEQAAAEDAEAIAMLATIEAVGAGRPRNWQRAFELLAHAAERGSDHARAQLKLLDGRTAEALLAAPPPSALSSRPMLSLFEDFASAGECGWVIARMRDRLAPAMIWDPATGLGKVDPQRSGSAVELRLNEMDVIIALLRARISAATRLPEFIFEVPQVMHYAVGQEFALHHDFLDPRAPGPAADIARRGQRMGTFLIFLNDDYAGGETEFPKAGIAHRGKAGGALFFANLTPDGQPDPLSLHAGRPPTSGEKWVFSQWIRDRAPAPT
ncbi:MAG TPA: 2OG-Fe(II) oxygenase [Allosphingosinicella sp.]|nr:2OG-Fe(II) oxygenase [Allosphingosinicella sp.]